MADSAPAHLPAQGSLMRGKRGLIMGVANDRSLAWGIASACAAQGAELAFTFQGDALERRVRPLAQQVASDLVFPCDVADEASIDSAFAALAQRWDGLDFLVHAIGFADKQYLRGRDLDTPRAAFLQAMDISCYSFTAVCQRAVPMMKPGGSLLTLSYLGAERWVPHYNVMGVAKAALEASVRYLAADLGGQRANPSLQRLTLEGERQFGALCRTRRGDAPGQGAVVGDAHDHAALAAHQTALDGKLCRGTVGHDDPLACEAR